MIEPTGYTALDLIGFTDRGAYDPDAYYVKNDITTVGNTKWRCLIDDTHNVTPTEGANWTIYLESATSLAGMDDTDITSPKEYDILMHNGTEWENSDVLKEQEVVPSSNLCSNEKLISTTYQGTLTVTVNPTGYPKGCVRLQGYVASGQWIDVNNRTMKLTTGNTYRMLGSVGGGTGTYRLVYADDGGGSAQVYDGETNFVCQDADSSSVYIFVNSTGASSSNPIDTVIYPMITADLTATVADYEPYWKTVKDAIFTQAQNNILGSKNVAVGAFHNGTENGITWTVDSENVVAITASAGSVGPANITSDEFILPRGRWILSKNPIQIPNIRIALLVSGSAVAITYDEEIAYYASSDTKCRIRLYVPSTTGALNVKFYPMIRPSIVKDNSYAPPAKTNRQLMEDVTGYEGISAYITPVTSGNSIETNNMVVDALGKLRIVHVTVKFSADVNFSVKVATAKAGSMPRSLIGFPTTTAGMAKSGYINTSGEIYVDNPRAGWTYAQLIYVAQ